MGLQGQSWYMDLIRQIFAFLDKLVYGLIKWILFGIFDLSHLTTNSEIFSGIYSRIYVILGIFMAFKLAFSFFQYIIDPESMTGKGEKTISKLFMRVFIMLAALIFLPTILFGSNGQEGFLSRAQRAFLPTLPKFLFGVNDIGGLATNGDNFSASIEQSADEIATVTLSGFFAPPKELDEVCGPGTYEKTPPIKTLDDFSNNINLPCDKVGTGFIGLFATKYYKYSYMMFISTVVGVLIAALLLGVTLDVAKRIFKLMILEVIAPIPIMSLIDPKGSKDGAFSKWVHSLITTFLDIFLKLGLVYLIIILIHMIVNSGDSGGMFTNFPSGEGTEFRQVYLTILLILGLIFFAKEAPKFIKESMGIKDSGGGLFDDVKSIGKAAGLVGGAAVGTAGVIGSTVGNVRAQMQGNKEYYEGQHVRNALRNIGAGISGAVGGTAAMASGLTGKDGGLRSVMKKQQERNANNFDYRRNGGTLFGRVGSSASRTFTGETTATKLGREITAMENEKALIKAATDRAASEMPKSDATRGAFGNLGGSYNYKAVKAAMDAAAATGASEITVHDYDTGTDQKISMEKAYYNIGSLGAANEADYLKNVNVSGSGIEDGGMKQIFSNATSGGVQEKDLRNRKVLKDRIQEIDGKMVERKQKQTKAKANDKYSANKK